MLNGDTGDDSIFDHRGDDELTGAGGTDWFFFGTGLLDIFFSFV
jgi:Ca2+-binding RTX toxin-like protein